MRCQGIAGAVFQFIIAFAPPLGSSNINDSLILCNKAARNELASKRRQRIDRVFMSFHRTARGPESRAALNPLSVCWSV